VARPKPGPGLSGPGFLFSDTHHLRLAAQVPENYYKLHNYQLNASSPSLSGFRDPIPGGSRRILGNGRLGHEGSRREASGLAAEIIDLFEGGAFSFWEWGPATNQLSTRGAFTAPTLKDWLLRIHPRDQAAFSEFLDQDWNLAGTYVSIDYRLNAQRPGDWIKVRHTLGLASRRSDGTITGIVEELSSPNLSRTLLERTESELREAELRVQRFIEGAVAVEGQADPLPLLELLRHTLRCDSVALVRVDPGLAPTEVIESNLEAVSFPFEQVRGLLTETLAAPSTEEFQGVAEFDLDPSVSAVAWFSARPVRLAGGRIAGALCAGYRTAAARIASRRFRSLLPLAATFAAERFERQLEEGHRRDLLAQLRDAQRLSGLGRVTGGFAHDLKNLLTLIEGHLHLLDKAFAYGDLESGRDSLRQICDAAGQANDFSSRLLLFGGKSQAELRACNLNRVVERFVAMMRRVLEENIEIHLDLDPAIAAIRADEGLLREILLNLIVNARDAMLRGGKVILSTRSEHLDSGPNGVYVSLSVTDEGRPGPDRRFPAHPDPFPLPETDPTGSSLGLYHVSSIVGELGGQIEQPDPAGAGHQIRLLFPAADRVAEPERTGTRHHAPSRPGSLVNIEGKTILLVEDEVAVRKLARKLLEVIGCEVIEAASGREALDRWPEIRDRVSLVVSDVVMPEGVSGWDLTHELHHRHPDLGILLTSGYSDLPSDHGLGGIPQIEFLQKPYGAGALKASLSRLVNLDPA
jgi:nitrogen-specific signal transduction histidine kinase/CheY-like chemotaxis protein